MSMMKKKIMKLLLKFLMLTVLIGCSTEEIEGVEQELGLFSFGMTIDTEWGDVLQFIYYGDYIRLPYHVEGWAQTVDSEFGWFLYVDGLPQSTRLENADGEVFREESWMHHFSLSYRERYEFYVVFKPVSGVIGEIITVVGAAMLQPYFMPESIDDPSFWSFHALGQTGSMHVKVENEVSNELQAMVSLDLEPLSEVVLTAERKWLGEEANLELDFQNAPRIAILPDGAEFELHYYGVIMAEDSYARFTFFAYGGEEVMNRIVFFVNHEPVQVSGYDFIEIQMEAGNMLKVDVRLQLDDLETFNALYAMMTTPELTGPIQTLFKTQTLLLVNE